MLDGNQPSWVKPLIKRMMGSGSVGAQERLRRAEVVTERSGT